MARLYGDLAHLDHAQPLTWHWPVRRSSADNSASGPSACGSGWRWRSNSTSTFSPALALNSSFHENTTAAFDAVGDGERAPGTACASAGGGQARVSARSSSRAGRTGVARRSAHDRGTPAGSPCACSRGYPAQPRRTRCGSGAGTRQNAIGLHLVWRGR